MEKLKRKLSRFAHGKKDEHVRRDSKSASALMSVCAALVPTRSILRSCEHYNAPVFQNFQLVWLDTNIDGSNNYINSDIISILRNIANNVNTFIDVIECTDFIKDIEEENIILIISGKAIQSTLPIIHKMSQITSIYIFCENKLEHELWIHQWPKIKGIHMDIAFLCEALDHATQECDRNNISMSFIETNENTSTWNFDDLDRSFVYIHIIKEIILNIDFKERDIKEFISYYRKQIIGNTTELKNIEKFGQEYHDYGPIWWYTSECLFSSMLNRILRLMEVERIIKMSFFIRNLHQNINQLHTNHHESSSFIVYHSQGVSQTTFDQLMKTQNGFISFNDFLFVTKKRHSAMNYIHQMISNSNLINILFVMTIDPSTTSTPFANIRDVCCYPKEEEILLSIQSTFRIDQIKQIDNHSNRLWEVELTLCDQNDIQFSTLIKTITEKTASYGKGWCRLSELLLQQNQIIKAQNVCESALIQTQDEKEKAALYYQLGSIKFHQNEYLEANSFYKSSLEIRQRILSPDSMDIAACYSGMGLACEKTNEYSKALSSYEKAYEIYEKILPENTPCLIKHLDDIARVYSQMEQFSKSLLYYQKALETGQKILPSNSSDLAAAYKNIGSMFEKMNQHEKAISFFIQALAIYEKAHPRNQSDIAESYHNIGSVYDKSRQYSIALTYYEEALKIRQEILPINHPNLAATYSNMASIYFHRANFLDALRYYEKAHEIYRKILPANHPDLAASYMCHGSVYEQIGRYRKALLYYQQAREIYQNVQPTDSFALATVYNSISSIYAKLGEYSLASRFSDCASDIEQKSSIGGRSSDHSAKTT
ncbi:hypothetical protein I4U23_002198 [Adineta vaga]|nr:hypothetical protein I4U23_002198 [Adineta vaga]